MYVLRVVVTRNLKGSATQKAACRGGKAFELQCVRLHHRRQTGGGLTRRAADICVLETDLPGGQCGMAEEFTGKLIEKLRESSCGCSPAQRQTDRQTDGDIGQIVPSSH